jgi:regulator of sirC expression with transglutaminase-like and TPR domain
MLVDLHTPGKVHTLVDGAILLAWTCNPLLDIASVRDEILRLETLVRSRWLNDPSNDGLEGDDLVMAKLKTVSTFLYEEEGFHPPLSFSSLTNSLLDHVLVQKCGHPSLMSVIFKTLGAAIDLPVHTIHLPHHIVCGVRLPSGGALLLDTFDKGNIISSKEEAYSLVGTSFPDKWFAPTPPIQVYARMLSNIINMSTSDFVPTYSFTLIEASLGLLDIGSRL